MIVWQNDTGVSSGTQLTNCHLGNQHISLCLCHWWSVWRWKATFYRYSLIVTTAHHSHTARLSGVLSRCTAAFIWQETRQYDQSDKNLAIDIWDWATKVAADLKLSNLNKTWCWDISLEWSSWVILLVPDHSEGIHYFSLSSELKCI